MNKGRGGVVLLLQRHHHHHPLFCRLLPPLHAPNVFVPGTVPGLSRSCATTNIGAGTRFLMEGERKNVEEAGRK